MIVIVDYGMGNLRSVSKALENLGSKVKVSSSPKDIENADKVVLPGVGAFGDAVRELRQLGLFESLQNYLSGRKPFLGICLGLQLLFKTSEEDKDATGLGSIPGSVQRFKSKNVKIPHMGWNQVAFSGDHPVLKGIPADSNFYFVHSFYGLPADPKLVLGKTNYGDETFPAIIGSETCFATQFHPEKSQKAGLAILKNFIRW
ncbi:MAG: imidazole glycerol phosphate synthase subunit HisH [Candidatus Omnitrophica bacterium]|nr:imidazole glycerol phosphate synthase subunit HisH [Candidatus Omnitrophota bacterium]